MLRSIFISLLVAALVSGCASRPPNRNVGVGVSKTPGQKASVGVSASRSVGSRGNVGVSTSR